ncbi:MAG: hypothetical protein SGI88_13380 [Candidatus Hydrogenedentes bacterium]|nr:hypothetical protein [Candidatus Hydrogenedentota bacterium]
MKLKFRRNLHCFGTILSLTFMQIFSAQAEPPNKESAADIEPIYEQLRQGFIKTDTTVYPKPEILYQDVPELVKRIEGWLQSDPAFDEPGPRMMAYFLLGQESIIRTQPGTRAILKGLTDESPAIRYACAISLDNSPKRMHAEIVNALEAALDSDAFSDTAHVEIERMINSFSNTSSTLALPGVETWVIDVLGGEIFDSRVARITTDKMGASVFVDEIEKCLMKLPDNLESNLKLNAYRALALTELGSIPKTLDLLRAGLLVEGPAVQMTCFQGLRAIDNQQPGIAMAALEDYLQDDRRNKDVDIQILAFLFTKRFSFVTHEIAKAASERINLYPQEQMYTAYCVAIMLAGMSTAEAAAAFYSTDKSVNILQIGFGISLGLAKLESEQSLTSAAVVPIRQFVLSLIAHKDAAFRESGLVAASAILGPERLSRTPEQVAINKTLIEAVDSVKSLKNTPTAELYIQSFLSSFDESGYFLAKKEIAEKIHGNPRK